MTQEEQIKQVAEYVEYTDLKQPGQFSLDWLNPVWVKVYAEMKGQTIKDWRFKVWENNYHGAIDYGDISAALTAVSDAITWLKEQKK